MSKKTVPKRLQAILWSTDVKKLDLEQDKEYIIPQLLIYGTLEEIRWLFRVYSKASVTRCFLEHPMKLYYQEAFWFIKNYLLDLQDHTLNPDDYVTSIYGPIRQRTANSV